MSEKSEVIDVVLPEGRVINEALFERDIFKSENGKEGEPKYKIELAFDPDDILENDDLIDAIIDAASDKWGDDIAEDIEAALEDPQFKGDVRLPFISGDKLAKKRKQNGKAGDAYEGKIVIRADTKYNKDGVEGPGGIQVFDEEVKEIEAVNRGQIYPGCFGVAAVVVSCYTDNEGDPGIKFYLSGFQKTNEGDKLVAQRDRSELFKPVGRKKSGASKRKSRKG